MEQTMETVTFNKKNESGSDLKTLIVPEEFVRDLHYSSEKHLMIMIRVMGHDSAMVRDYFINTEEEVFNIETTAGFEMDNVSDNFKMVSIYMDEGPSLSVDITQEQAMVRVLMDLELVGK